MTAFLLIAALLVAAAVAVVIVPLHRARAAGSGGLPVAILVAALVIPLAAAGLYYRLSNWSWDPTALAAASSQQHSIDEMIAKLEQRLKSHPDDVEGWLMLARSREVMQDLPGAVKAFGEAYRASAGRNADVMVEYAEALAMSDPASLGGRGGELIEDALKLDPSNPKALFYGGMTALVAKNVDLARTRWTTLLKQPLPADVRAVVASRIVELDRQLGRTPDPAIVALASAPAAAPETAPAQAPTSGPGSATVHVQLAPALAARVPAGAVLYVLARDPGQPGPPFGAKRLPTASFPLDVTLTDADAMLPSRTLKDAHSLVIVARLSASGSPQAGSGDLYGEVPYDLARGAPVDLVIDKVVP